MTKQPTKDHCPHTALNVRKVFVLHVRKGYEKRGQHIERMLGKMGVPFEYILDGDVCDLTDDVLDRYFRGEMMKGQYPFTSCSYKHLLAYKEIEDRDIDGALILEDDIFLKKDFIRIFNKSMDEVRKYSDEHPGPVIISYEDTRLRFIPRSKRKKDTVIYKADRDRMTGAFYINRAAARLLTEYAETHKFDLPIDLMYCKLLRDGRLTYFWCQPTVATQGSHTGAFTSAINFKKNIFYPLSWQFKLHYRKLLYFFR